MDQFWTNRFVQYTTIAMSFLPLLVAVRAWRKYEGSRTLSPELLRTFRKQCSETLAQYMLALGLPILYVLFQTWAAGQDLASNLTNGYLTAAALAGAASLWNVRKAHRDTKSAALHPSNKARASRLRDVEERNLGSYSPALISLLIGTIGLIAYNQIPSPPPWFWFAAFLLTSLAAYSLAWSNSTASVAAAYDGNPKMGRKGQP
jgi:hypothetical protein